MGRLRARPASASVGDTNARAIVHALCAAQDVRWPRRQYHLSRLVEGGPPLATPRSGVCPFLRHRQLHHLPPCCGPRRRRGTCPRPRYAKYTAATPGAHALPPRAQDSLFLASGGKDLSVIVHSVHRLPAYSPATLSGHRSSVRAIFFGVGGHLLYAVTRDGALNVWELQRRPGKGAAALAAPQRDAPAEDGVGHREDSLGVWWVMSARHFFDKNHARVTSAAFHEETQILVVGFQTGVFAIYELPGGAAVAGASLTAGGMAAAQLTSGHVSGKPGARPPESRGIALTEIHTLSISDARVDACSISASGEWLAFGCGQLGQLLVWEWRSETYILKQQGHYFAEVSALAYSPSGSTVATGGGDSKVKLWSPASGFCIVTFIEHAAPVTDLAFVPHGRALVSASLDGTVRAFDLLRYRNFQTLVSPEPAQFGCVCVDPSGEIVCAGSRDTLSIYVWNLQTAMLLERLTGHEGPISCLVFGGGADGVFLASGSWDQTVRVWDFIASKVLLLARTCPPPPAPPPASAYVEVSLSVFLFVIFSEKGGD